MQTVMFEARRGSCPVSERQCITRHTSLTDTVTMAPHPVPTLALYPSAQSHSLRYAPSAITHFVTARAYMLPQCTTSRPSICSLIQTLNRPQLWLSHPLLSQRTFFSRALSFSPERCWKTGHLPPMNEPLLCVACVNDEGTGAFDAMEE